MTIIITPTLCYPLAYWLRQIVPDELREGRDGVTRLVVWL